jgi:cytochrome d ubiquinol oxidase subunit II
VELRGHVDNAVWRPFWDVVFAGASGLLAIFFGAALGNVIRGVPLDAAGDFFLPLWTDFSPGPRPGILDWYTVLIAVAALVTLTVHGALWVALKVDGDPGTRARRIAQWVWPLVGVAVVAITTASFRVQPHIANSFVDRPWGYIFAALALIGLIGMLVLSRRQEDLKAFLASSLFIAAMLASAAFGVYPWLLPSNGDPALSLDIHKAASPPYALGIGLAWFIPGMLLVAGYFFYTYRSFAGKVRPE